MLKALRVPFLATALALLAGCSTVPPPSPARAPETAAPAAPPPPPATLVGSQESSALLDNFTAYVIAVDGRAIPGGRKAWDRPFALTPGPHRITVGFIRGVFVARADLNLTAAPATRYELRYASDAQVYGRHSYCDFWIVDAGSGRTVVPATRAVLAHSERSEE
jgi:hypothetical protein